MRVSSLLLVLVIGVNLTGCATKTVVVPAKEVQSTKHYVVYKAKQPKRHCWKHRGHWHCQ